MGFVSAGGSKTLQKKKNQILNINYISIISLTLIIRLILKTCSKF